MEWRLLCGIYPIANTGHFIISGFPLIILTLYYTYRVVTYLLNKLDDKKRKILWEIFESASVFCIVIVIMTSIVIIGKWVSEIQINSSDIKHFENISIYESTKTNIKMVTEYIKNENEQGKEVYILDATACLYMIPLDRYNKDYDLFLIGNLGSSGEKGQIERIQQEVKNKKARILIKNDKYMRNWQNPEEVRKYIINNLNKIGEIGEFDIYE